jgi:WD40 repeat protein
LKSDQKRRWRQASGAVEDYLKRYPSLRSKGETILELIWNEVGLRRERGESPQPSEYVGRFPELADRIGFHFDVDNAFEEADRWGHDPFDPTPLGGPPSSPPVGDNPAPEHYELIREIGRTRASVVYEARQKSPDQIVAIKELLSPDEHERARFRRAAEAAARLEHPNIARIYKIGERDGHLYLVMQFGAGGNLDEKLAGTPQPPSEAAEMVKSLAEAMVYAHAHGVVHRDLKPANVVLTAEGSPLITDFGQAKRLGEAGETGSVEILGTAGYMPPEQAKGKSKQVEPVADVYALGAILYEMLTGRPPFRGESDLETLHQTLKDEPVPPRRLQPRVSRDLEAVCLKCLEKDPAHRLGGAQELADELGRFLEGKSTKIRPASPLGRFRRWCARNPYLAAASGLAMAAVVAVVVVSIVAAVSSQRASRRFQVIAADLALDRGLAAGNPGDANLAMLWLARSLELDPAHDDDRQRIIRTNLASWRHLMIPPGPLLKHLGPVYAVAFAPDGQRILTGCGDGTARLWDAAGGSIGPPFAHRAGAAVWGVAFSPDGKVIATAGADGTVGLWEVETGRRIRELESHEEFDLRLMSPLNDVRGVPTEGKNLIIVAAVNDVLHFRILDGDGKVVADTDEKRLTGQAGQIKDLREQLKSLWPPHRLTGSDKNQVITAVTSIVGHTRHEHGVRAVAFSPVDRTILTGCGDGVARLWDWASGRIIRQLPHPPAEDRSSAKAAGGRPGSLREVDLMLFAAVAFSRDGRRIATACAGSALLWDATDEQAVARPLPHPGNVVCLAFSPDGKTILTGGVDHAAKFWDVATGQPALKFDSLLHHDTVMAVAVSPDGRTVATGDADNIIRLWDPATPWVLSSSARHRGIVWSVAFSPDGKTVVTGGDDTTARLWALPRGDPSERVLRHPTGVSAAAFSPDGDTVVTGSADKKARLWNARTGGLIRTLTHPGRVEAVAFGCGGKILVTAGAVEGPADVAQSLIKVWDRDTGEPVGLPIRAASLIRAMALSPDGRRVLAGCTDGVTRLWDLDRPEDPCLEFSKHLDSVTAVAFNPQGTIILTGSADQQLRFWDALNGQPKGSPIGTSRSVDAAAFGPDSSTFLTGSLYGSAQLWSMATRQPLGPPFPDYGSVGAVASRGDFILMGTGPNGTCLFDVRSRKQLGPPVEQRGVRSVAFAPGGATFLTAGEDGTARIRCVPGPLEGGAERISLWVQHATDMELVEGATRWLDDATRERRRRRLAELGGPIPR